LKDLTHWHSGVSVVWSWNVLWDVSLAWSGLPSSNRPSVREAIYIDLSVVYNACRLRVEELVHWPESFEAHLAAEPSWLQLKFDAGWALQGCWLPAFWVLAYFLITH
jgi:hypothetical protein